MEALNYVLVFFFLSILFFSKHLECRVERPSLTTLKALANVKIEIEKIQSQAKRPPSKVVFFFF